MTARTLTAYLAVLAVTVFVALALASALYTGWAACLG